MAAGTRHRVDSLDARRLRLRSPLISQRTLGGRGKFSQLSEQTVDFGAPGLAQILCGRLDSQGSDSMTSITTPKKTCTRFRSPLSSP